jgi:hypothetical protein
MKTYRWSYDERVTLEEFIKRITPMVESPVNNMWEMEGDLFMSDCRMLSEAAMRLHNLVDDIEENEELTPVSLKVVTEQARKDREERTDEA